MFISNLNCGKIGFRKNNKQNNKEKQEQEEETTQKIFFNLYFYCTTKKNKPNEAVYFSNITIVTLPKWHLRTW